MGFFFFYGDGWVWGEILIKSDWFHQKKKKLGQGKDPRHAHIKKDEQVNAARRGPPAKPWR